MTAPATGMSTMGAMVKQRGMADHMEPFLWTDQHGRQWTGQMSLLAKDKAPATPTLPHVWRAPFVTLLPPEKFKTFPRLGVMVIDYRAWLADVRAAWRGYEQDVAYWGDKRYGAAWRRMWEEGDAELRRDVGPSPVAPEFIEAMMAHEADPRAGRWALGLPKLDGSRYTEPPAWAKPLLATLYVPDAWIEDEDAPISDVARYLDDDSAPAETVESAEIAARLAEASRFADLDDEDTAPTPQPVRRGPGRPRKNASPDAG